MYPAASRDEDFVLQFDPVLFEESEVGTFRVVHENRFFSDFGGRAKYARVQKFDVCEVGSENCSPLIVRYAELESKRRSLCFSV